MREITLNKSLKQTNNTTLKGHVCFLRSRGICIFLELHLNLFLGSDVPVSIGNKKRVMKCVCVCTNI